MYEYVYVIQYVAAMTVTGGDNGCENTEGPETMSSKDLPSSSITRKEYSLYDGARLL